MPQHGTHKPTATIRSHAVYISDHGFTYLAAMLAIVLLGISLSAVGRQWTLIVQRDQEAELLFRGDRIKQAIEAYEADYEVRKGTRDNRYPLRLEQLVEGPKLYLPVLYKDPMTREDFDVIRINGEIRGVKSRSSQKPLNRIQFNDASAYNKMPFEARSPFRHACGTAGNPVNPLNPLGAGPCRPWDGAVRDHAHSP